MVSKVPYLTHILPNPPPKKQQSSITLPLHLLVTYRVHINNKSIPLLLLLYRRSAQPCISEPLLKYSQRVDRTEPDTKLCDKYKTEKNTTGGGGGFGAWTMPAFPVRQLFVCVYVCPHPNNQSIGKVTSKTLPPILPYPRQSIE